jgi:glucose/arabinose dehydrogenase
MKTLVYSFLWAAIFILHFSNIQSQGSPSFHLVANGFSAPTDIANAGDGSKRIFVAERSGIIKSLKIFSTGVELSTFIDISDHVRNNGERGLLGLVFHPNFPDSGYFYVNYIPNGPGNLDTTRISRFTVNPADSTEALTDSEKVVIQFEQDFTNHNGGDMNFGSDGFLYIASGDGGSGNDPNNRAQDTTSLLGKMLRINVDNDDFPEDNFKNYAIVPGNPFVGTGGSDEIWSFGWRNPWRFSFDPMTNFMYVGDVGQDAREEISLDSMNNPGGNFGWRCKEGFTDTGLTGCLSTPEIDPLFEYAHNNGNCSITGGYVYRGTSFPAFQGWYFSIDFCSGKMYRLDADNGYEADSLVLNTFGNISTFGISESGELYAASIGGQIYRLVDTEVCPDNIVVNVIDTTYYSANLSITSDATINPPDTITFSAGQSVNLDMGFEVKHMATFLAKNVSCMQQIINSDGP